MSLMVSLGKHGGPEVLIASEQEVPAPGPGEVTIRHEVVGLNFVDTYFRSGLYPVKLPFVPGNEGAGTVIAVGPEVSEFREGDRVAYATASGGAYAEIRNVSAKILVPLPDAVDFETAAAAMLKGMTVQYLVRHSFELRPDHTILVHAAAGGVGQILVQWAKSIGATVIGTVGSPEKKEPALAAGCDHVIMYRDEDFASAVRELTSGRLCDAVYDGVGQATYPASLDCVKPRGLLVSFGNASGPIRNFDLLLLARKGSLYVTRPTLETFNSTRADLLANAQDLFDQIASGHVKIAINGRFALADAADAHRALESRATTGATILQCRS